MDDCIISIIVPVYNVEQYLDKCIESLLKQTYKYIEIILVDDGSTDNSGSICDEYARKSSNIHVIHTENRGLSAARNSGLRIAKGVYIGFVDSDDWVESDTYMVLWKNLIMHNADISCIAMKYEYVDDADNVLKKNNIVTECNITGLLTAIIKHSGVYGYVWNKLFKRELICGLEFNEMLRSCEDLVFTTQYAIRCKKGVYTDSELYHYRQRSTSMTGELGYSDRKISVLDAYEKIMPLYQEYCPQSLYLLSRNYLKISINILGRMRCSHYKNEDIEKRLKMNVDQTYLKVMRDPRNSKSVRFNIWVSKRFPGMALKIKQTFLKKHRR